MPLAFAGEGMFAKQICTLWHHDGARRYKLGLGYNYTKFIHMTPGLLQEHTRTHINFSANVFESSIQALLDTRHRARHKFPYHLSQSARSLQNSYTPYSLWHGKISYPLSFCTLISFMRKDIFHTPYDF